MHRRGPARACMGYRSLQIPRIRGHDALQRNNEDCEEVGSEASLMQRLREAIKEEGAFGGNMLIEEETI